MWEIIFDLGTLWWTVFAFLFLLLFWKYLTNSMKIMNVTNELDGIQFFYNTIGQNCALKCRNCSKILGYQLNLGEAFEEFSNLSSGGSFTASELTSPISNVSVFIGSWNLGGNCPSSLKNWLTPNSFRYDVYVIGVQECNYVVNHDQEYDPISTEKNWFSLVEKTICDSNALPEYDRVITSSRGSQRIIIFAKKRIVSRITDIQQCNVPCCGTSQNPGIIGLSFRINETLLCFLHCQLNPETSETDFMKLLNQIHLGDYRYSVLEGYFHHVFLLGSFCFPIHLPSKSIKQHILSKNWQALESADGFEILKQQYPALQYLKEKPQETPPYCSKTKTYYWADRILYGSMHNCVIQQDNFQRVAFKDKLFFFSHFEHPAIWSLFNVEVHAIPSSGLFKSFEIVFNQISLSPPPRSSSVSNPYLSFYIPMSDKTRSPCSTVKHKVSGEVTWTKLQLPSIRVSLLQASNLQYILIGVFDRRVTENDEFIGQTTIHGTEGEFNAPLYKDAKKLEWRLSVSYQLVEKRTNVNHVIQEPPLHKESNSSNNFISNSQST